MKMGGSCSEKQSTTPEGRRTPQDSSVADGLRELRPAGLLTGVSECVLAHVMRSVRLLAPAGLGSGVPRLDRSISGLEAPALLHALIHRSAWKVNSANFVMTEFYEVRPQK